MFCSSSLETKHILWAENDKEICWWKDLSGDGLASMQNMEGESDNFDEKRKKIIIALEHYSLSP